MLPLWLQITQAIFLFVLSALGAWIAYNQVQIAAAKYNLDLYDKRFDVFEGARDFVMEILQTAQFDDNSLRAYNFRVANVIFLFEPDVTKYVDGLRRKALSLRMKTRQLNAAQDDERRRDKLIDEIAVLEGDFATEYERLVAVFQSYLKLRNISAANDLLRTRIWLLGSWQKAVSRIKKTWEQRPWPGAKD
jgi:hypothetical protein